MFNEMPALAQVHKAVFSAVFTSSLQIRKELGWGQGLGHPCNEFLDAGDEIQAPGGGNLAAPEVERGNVG